MQSPTKQLLRYLHSNPGVRARIAAPPGRTLLYAGSFVRPMWRELEQLKYTSIDVASKVMLPEVLAGIHTTDQPHQTLLTWVKTLDELQPWDANGFVAWRALSGIFASNASGPVSFAIGSGVTRDDKVFAATELPVLLRNPNIDTLTKDILAYYQRCVQQGRAAMNFGFIGG